jgi:hypothetical protein
MSRPEPEPAACCHTILADGSRATVTATRRARAGRADVKCSVPGDPALARRMQAVVRAARLTEPLLDMRDQVVLSIDCQPGAQERDWELAAVLADRMARGLHPVTPELWANGWSDHWHLGRIDGCRLAPPARAGHLLGGPGGLPHLGLLLGQPDPGARVATVRTWFPLYSGRADDQLVWVEVSVHPLAVAGMDEEDTIAVPGADAALQLAVRQVLAGARHFDGRALGRWRTVVRFEQPRFEGQSYELALVLADRLARGREFPARGRVLASGCSGAWHSGAVESVDGIEPKLRLIRREARRGDRVLLPKAWEPQLGEEFKLDLRERGVAVACIERIGII